MNDKFAERRNKIIFFVLVVAAIVAFILLRRDNEVLRYRAIDVVDIPVFHQAGSYAEFLSSHAQSPNGTARIEIDILNPSGGENFSTETFEGREVLRSEESSYVEFAVNVPSAGLYTMQIEYFPVSARGIDITRELRINGEIPFIGAELITLRRVWGSDPDNGGMTEFVPATSARPATYIRQDSRGNQIRPRQVELPRWERTYFIDRLGFFTDPYRFYFEAGENIISLRGLNEPLVMSSLAIVPIETLLSHAEFTSASPLSPNTSDFSATIQGEWSTVRSSPSLFPSFDNSSGATNPASVATIKLNMIGGTRWRMPGQWIEWDVEVPADGLYRISMSARQNYNRGFVSSRTVSINGEVPFAEAAAVPFRFNNSWELNTLQDENGNDLLFPMNAGVNSIRMYVTLGELGELLDALQASTRRLNTIYREILVLTGPEPDALRDYRIDTVLPHVIVMIEEEISLLYGILLSMEEFLGERNAHTGIITTTVQQLDLFAARPHRIPTQLTNFRQNISAIANATRALTENPLDIDFIVVSGTSAQLPRVKETFLTRASHEIRSFVASFIHDFESIGDIHEDGEMPVIDVWITTGRDQAAVLKSMIDDTFTPLHGTGVNLRLVTYQAVLPAFVAGIGPDVVLNMQATDPANYAFRNAAADLSQFEDFDEVFGRFHEAAWIRLRYIDSDGHVGFYGIPETQTFNLMFYRTDILGEMGFDAPESWDDVLAMMPLLQRNNMAVGIPPIGNAMAPDISGFMTQLYQRGGFLYTDDLSRARLDDESAVGAFEAYTRFFTHYGSPEQFEALNRFRSGEMPIIIGDFGMFNTLSVFAPEISGQWSFGLMPGHDHDEPVPFRRGDGEVIYARVHHTVPDFGQAAIMNQDSDMKAESWDFLRWLTSTETQVRFAREMESILGEAARHPTANLEAFQRLPWSNAQLEVLNAQRDWVLGTPEMPGGYYVQRQLINVIRRVVNDNLDTRETLLDVNIVINRELISKRREFGLEE
ncbi:MAG: extracellular solute-binding protein [Clostridiales bacterium]|jgi:ABC-type glycerol-3-phosphate transport system substrate-binding protein|nr:extracellular solute-binding protein [Clostridiales bacterium]